LEKVSQFLQLIKNDVAVSMSEFCNIYCEHWTLDIGHAGRSFETRVTDINLSLSFFLIIKPTRCTNFSNLFWNETLHVSDSSCVHHQELFTVHSAVMYVMQVCRQLSSRIRMELVFFFHPDPAAQKLSTNLYDIYHC
jgi:hypothetical protein